MAAGRAGEERLKALRAEIARDAAELRRRLRGTRDRVPREWREMRTVTRDFLELFWLLFRRRGVRESTPPGAPPSSQ